VVEVLARVDSFTGHEADFAERKNLEAVHEAIRL